MIIHSSQLGSSTFIPPLLLSHGSLSGLVWINISCLLYVSLSEPPNQFLSVHHLQHVACFQQWQQQRSKGMNAVTCTECHWCTTALFMHCSHSTVTNYTCLQEKRNWSEEGWGVEFPFLGVVCVPTPPSPVCSWSQCWGVTIITKYNSVHSWHRVAICFYLLKYAIEPKMRIWPSYWKMMCVTT